MKLLCIFLGVLLHSTLIFAQSANSNGGSTERKNPPEEKHPDSLGKPFISPSTQLIVYDFETGKYLQRLKQIRVHTPVVFEIRNINPFAYNIKIAAKDSVIAASSFDKSVLQWISKYELQTTQAKLDQEAAAAETQSAQTGNVENNDTNAGGGNKSAPNPTAEAVNSGLQIGADNQVAIKKVEDLKKQLEDINIVLQDTVRNKANAKALIEKKGDIEQVISDLQSEVRKNIDSADATMKRFLEFQSEFMYAYGDYMLDCQRVFRIVRNAKLLTTMAEDPGLNEEIFKEDYKLTFLQILLEIRDDRKHFNDFRRSYSELNNVYARLMHDPELQKSLKQSGVDKLYAYPNYVKGKADALHSRLVQLPIETYMKQSEWITTRFRKGEAFVYRSAPLQPVNDWIEFKVDISQKNGSITKDYYSERSFIYHQPTYGGTRVDFSLGLAASYFGSTSVYDLGINTSSSNSGLLIYEKSRELIAPSLVGLVTMSVRRTKYAAYGGSAGLGIDVLDGKIQLSNFFIGPTVLFGKFDRIFLSGGFSFKNVQQLEQGYEVLKSPGQATKISQILDDKYKVGVFLSITYSLTDNAKKMLQSF